MGAGASATEKTELRTVFEAFKAAPGNGDGLTDAAFAALVEKDAPTFFARLEASGGGDPAPALAAFRSQLRGAREKLAAAPPPRDDVAAKARAAKLRSEREWAADVPTNLQRGLVTGLLRSHPLRLLTFELCGESIKGLLDTGAERSALGATAADRCGLAEIIDDSFARRVQGVGSAAGLGRVHYVELRVGDCPFRAAFDVARCAETNPSKAPMQWFRPRSCSFRRTLNLRRSSVSIFWSAARRR